MKKIISVILAFLLCFAFSSVAFAEEGEPMPGGSPQPRFMVTGYTVDGGFVSPSQETTISVTFKNYSSQTSLSNIKFTFSDESGQIVPQGMGTQYVNKVTANGTYTWKIKVKASATAEVGEHKVVVSSEFEDKNFASYSGSDTLLIPVRQKTSLDYEGLSLPKKVVQEDTVTMDVNLMNTGKSNIRNAKINFDIDSLRTGGVLFIGEIPAGESKTGSANFQVDKEKLSDVTGTAALYYEDDFGESYTETINLSTVIEEKVEKPQTEEEEETKYPLWWLFLVVGVVVGGAVGAGIPIGIYSKKQRKEDELRL